MATNITIGAGITVGAGIGLGATVVKPGLQLYLDALSTNSYPGTGTTWYDLTNNNNHVTMQNSSSIVHHSTGGGYFDTGSNGWFSNPAATTGIPTGSTPYTISAWVQYPAGWPTSGSGDGHAMVTIGSTATYFQFNDFGIDNSGYLYNSWFSNGSPSDLTANTWTPAVPGTAWANLALTWDGSTRSIWYNGVQQVSQAAGSALGNNTDILIGNDYMGWSNFLQGNIGQVLIYSRALSTTELTRNFNAVKNRYGV